VLASRCSRSRSNKPLFTRVCETNTYHDFISNKILKRHIHWIWQSEEFQGIQTLEVDISKIDPKREAEFIFVSKLWLKKTPGSREEKSLKHFGCREIGTCLIG